MNSLEDSWRIDTPENIAFDYVVAGIESRFLAALVDLIAILLLLIAVDLTLLLVSGVLTGHASDPNMTICAIAALGLLSFCFLWGYYVFCQVLWNGQSPGKRWVKPRVVRADGMPITFTESVIRNLVPAIVSCPRTMAWGW